MAALRHVMGLFKLAMGCYGIVSQLFEIVHWPLAFVKNRNRISKDRFGSLWRDAPSQNEINQIK